MNGAGCLRAGVAWGVGAGAIGVLAALSMPICVALIIWYFAWRARREHVVGTPEEFEGLIRALRGEKKVQGKTLTEENDEQATTEVGDPE